MNDQRPANLQNELIRRYIDARPRQRISPRRRGSTLCSDRRCNNGRRLWTTAGAHAPLATVQGKLPMTGYAGPRARPYLIRLALLDQNAGAPNIDDRSHEGAKFLVVLNL